MKTSQWTDCDLLYFTRITRFGKRTIPKTDVEGAVAIFHVPEEARVVSAVFEFNHREVDAIMLVPLSEIRQISPSAENALDLLVVLSDTDVSWRFLSQIDRDEATLVLCQLSKSIYGVNYFSGHMSELDIASFGFEQRFPALFKIFQLTTSVHDDDEKEAELLLEQLDWTKPIPELQHALQDDILDLNVEICDLLLQWEEDDVVTSFSGSVSRMRDTVELLTNLNQADRELAVVDDWLGKQIIHLSEVQKGVAQIKSESGMLETSLQNLTAVKLLISSVVGSLQVSKEEEETLLKADKNIRMIISSNQANISVLEAEIIIDPIIHALESLRRAMSTNESVLGSDASKNDWEHLKIVSGIQQQRQKLIKIASDFCHNVSESILYLFGAVLKHRLLNDPSRQTSVVIRKFSFTSLQPILVPSMMQESASIDENPSTIKNQMLMAQRAYQQTLSPFIPLIEHTIYLSSSFLPKTKNAYIEATQQLLYTPLVKQLFKELSVVTTPQQSVSFTTLPKTRAVKSTHNGPNTLLKFHESVSASSNSGNLVARAAIHIWDALMIAILLIAPVIEREMQFVQVKILKFESFYINFVLGPFGSWVDACRCQHSC